MTTFQRLNKHKFKVRLHCKVDITYYRSAQRDAGRLVKEISKEYVPLLQSRGVADSS